jgi:predicted aspartyl protease
MPVFNIQLTAQGKTPNGKVINLPPAAALYQRGPVVPVSVMLEANMAKPILAQGKGVMGQPGVALIDTGATNTVIDDETAKDLGIPVIDQGKMTSTTHADQPCNIYPVQITVGGQLIFQVPRCSGAQLKGMGLIAIIGRDILQRCTLVYNGGMGIVTLAF